MQHLILGLTLFFTSIIVGQSQETSQLKLGATLKVAVVNVLSDKGEIHFALYNETNFRMKPLFSKIKSIENGVSEVQFENIPNGEYAIVCFHDENKNGRMDFELNGMPLESYGTSNNALSFGPPQFEDSKFVIENEDRILEIKF